MKAEPPLGNENPASLNKTKKRYIKMVKVPQFSLKNQANKTNKDRLRIQNTSHNLALLLYVVYF